MIQNKRKKGKLKQLREHDSLTYNHSVRVANLSKDFGCFLNLNVRSLEEIYQIGLYHDIGKLYIDSTILGKENNLTDKEFQQVINHTIYGETILKDKGFSKDFLQTIRGHHENFNGTGYPDKLNYKEINQYSFILRIIDSYDAMTSNRPYKNRYSNDYAIEEIQSLKGEWYHPFFADEFCNFVQTQLSKKA